MSLWHHWNDRTEILLKVVLNTINQPLWHHWHKFPIIFNNPLFSLCISRFRGHNPSTLSCFFLQFQIKLTVYSSYAKALGVWATIVVFLVFSLYHGVSVYASFWLTFWTSDPYLTNQTNVGKDKFYDKVKYYLYGYGLLGIIQGILKSLNTAQGEVYSILLYRLTAGWWFSPDTRITSTY